MLNAMANFAEVPYNNLKVAKEMSTGYGQEYITRIMEVGGVVSPDALRFSKKQPAIPANEQGVAEAVGNSPRPATLRLPPAKGQRAPTPMPVSTPVKEPAEPLASFQPPATSEATVKMRFPSGAVRDVPASQVENAKARKGATLVGQ
jgi:hypothetical protein